MGIPEGRGRGSCIPRKSEHLRGNLPSTPLPPPYHCHVVAGSSGPSGLFPYVLCTHDEGEG